VWSIFTRVTFLVEEEERLGHVLQAEAERMRSLQAAHHRQRTRLLCEKMAAAPRAPPQEPQDPGVTELLQVQRCKNKQDQTIKKVGTVNTFSAAVLGIRDVYPGSRIRIFFITDPGSKTFPDPNPHPHQRY
jgi:hypothetical protein